MKSVATPLILLSLAAVISCSPVLEARQSTTMCNVSRDCYPAELGNVTIPMTLVECGDGVCSCRDCFTRNQATNKCALQPPCTSFNTSTLECGDTRLQQRTALLLSIFLSAFGAANFYIGQIGLAVPQLLIGLATCILSCVWSIYRSCTKESDNPCLLIGAVVLCIPATFFPLVTFSWWLADAIIFGTNQRLDGRGCPLVLPS